MDILLVPGFMLDADLWSDIRPDLERYGDLIDADMTRDLSIEAMAVRAVRSITAPAVVIGFSMGGYVARQIVYQAPDLVRSLALIATSSRGVAARPMTMIGQNGFRELSRSAVLRSLHPQHRSDDVIARVQRMSARLGGEVFYRQSQLDRVDDTELLSGISCPTAVIAAADDELRSVDESLTLHQNIPGSTMTVVEGSGHLIPLERPAALLAALKPIISAA